MQYILRKLKLVENLEVILKTNREKFVKKFRKHVDEEEIGFLPSHLERFTNGLSKYKGKVGYKGFCVKKRNRLFDLGRNLAVVTGTFSDRGSKLKVDLKITVFDLNSQIYYSLLTLFFFLLIASIFTGNSNILEGNDPMIIILMALIACFLYGLPYLMMRRSIRFIKNNILKDFKHLSKQ